MSVHYKLLENSTLEESKMNSNDLEKNEDTLNLEGTRFLNDEKRSCVQRLSNQTVLVITCAMFAAFVIAEVIGALAGNSLALLGDAAAMSVDVFTYFCNMYAERIKSQGRVIDERTRFLLEVYIPLFSVSALLGVTGWVTSDAIAVIMDGEGGDETDIGFLYGFACGNLLVDVVSSWMFYVRGADILKNRTFSFSVDVNDPEPVKEASKNLNMMSALTHVGGDTARSLSVFVAAVVATIAGNSTMCDAWATVVVSITIIIAVIPLLKEIYKAARRSS